MKWLNEKRFLKDLGLKYVMLSNHSGDNVIYPDCRKKRSHIINDNTI